MFSPKSMAIMFGNGTVESGASTIKKTINFTGTAAPTSWTDANGNAHSITSAVYYDATGSSVASDSLQAGQKYFATFDVPVTAETITVGPNTFPGTLNLLVA